MPANPAPERPVPARRVSDDLVKKRLKAFQKQMRRYFDVDDEELPPRTSIPGLEPGQDVKVLGGTDQHSAHWHAKVIEVLEEELKVLWYYAQEDLPNVACLVGELLLSDHMTTIPTTSVLSLCNISWTRSPPCGLQYYYRYWRVNTRKVEPARQPYRVVADEDVHDQIKTNNTTAPTQRQGVPSRASQSISRRRMEHKPKSSDNSRVRRSKGISTVSGASLRRMEDQHLTHTNCAKDPKVEASMTASVQRSRNFCISCQSRCQLCRIPTKMSQLSPLRLQEIAHEAAALRSHEAWSSIPIQFARCAGPMNETADVYKVSSDEILSRHVDDSLFNKPLIITESFSDDLSVKSVLQALLNTYHGMEMQIRHGDEQSPELMKVEDFVDIVMNGTQQLPLNALSIDNVYQACPPAFTHLDRFKLLKRLTKRVQASHAGSVVGKPVTLMPVDLRLSESFNIIATKGAYSDWHTDCSGGTVLRHGGGEKLFILSPPEVDRNAFKSRENDRNATGTAFAIVVDQTVDALYIPPAWKHEVLTLETAAMAGWMLMDRNDCSTALQHFQRIGEHPHISNEPLPYQLPDVVRALGKIVKHQSTWPERKATLKALKDIVTLACDCERCSSLCPCRKAKRRCLSWCKGHPELPAKGRPCMPS